MRVGAGIQPLMNTKLRPGRSLLSLVDHRSPFHPSKYHIHPADAYDRMNRFRSSVRTERAHVVTHRPHGSDLHQPDGDVADEASQMTLVRVDGSVGLHDGGPACMRRTLGRSVRRPGSCSSTPTPTARPSESSHDADHVHTCQPATRSAEEAMKAEPARRG